jgi:hypothetical protein
MTEGYEFFLKTSLYAQFTLVLFLADIARIHYRINLRFSDEPNPTCRHARTLLNKEINFQIYENRLLPTNNF